MPLTKLAAAVVPFKRQIYEAVAAQFSPLIHQY